MHLQPELLISIVFRCESIYLRCSRVNFASQCPGLDLAVRIFQARVAPTETPALDAALEIVMNAGRCGDHLRPGGFESVAPGET
jgi:hypothetical protein